MAHVFISYSSKHRDLTEELAAFLEGCGLDVWWDRDLEARGPFAGQIHDKLRAAGCVVVLWTPGALTSEWVKAEADCARERNMLVNVTAEGVAPTDLPQPFGSHEQHRPFETDLILRDVLAVREGRLLLEDKREPLPGPGERTPTMLLQAKFSPRSSNPSAFCRRNLPARSRCHRTVSLRSSMASVPSPATPLFAWPIGLGRRLSSGWISKRRMTWPLRQASPVRRLPSFRRARLVHTGHLAHKQKH